MYLCVMKFWLTSVIKGCLGADWILMWVVHAVGLLQ